MDLSNIEQVRKTLGLTSERMVGAVGQRRHRLGQIVALLTLLREVTDNAKGNAALAQLVAS
ncbi:MAG: hypothetical protein LLH30_18820 [Candidatus Manganitrophus sp. SA1]|nr:hypothetical protein [Candidatus Manganitrophus morganii]